MLTISGKEDDGHNPRDGDVGGVAGDIEDVEDVEDVEEKVIRNPDGEDHREIVHLHLSQYQVGHQVVELADDALSLAQELEKALVSLERMLELLVGPEVKGVEEVVQVSKETSTQVQDGLVLREEILIVLGVALVQVQLKAAIEAVSFLMAAFHNCPSDDDRNMALSVSLLLVFHLNPLLRMNFVFPHVPYLV